MSNAVGADSSASRVSISPTRVNRVVRGLLASSKTATRRNWLRAVASLTTDKRPDLAAHLVDILGEEPFGNGDNPLKGLTIGEVGVCYEALVALSDSTRRRAAGQYFTPDDAASFMAVQSAAFPDGVWMDPCCGIGNLAWHLAAVQHDSARFVRERLVLIDIDATALVCAVAILAADYLAPGDHEGLKALHARAHRRDFLAKAPLPEHDFVIVNPPYARAAVAPGMRTAATRDAFAYFLERVATTSRGFIAVTPASFLSAPKFAALREVLEESTSGGRIFVFDNVPDTLFRGYKFGSANTSSTNFVRAAITVCSPRDTSWQLTPIIRWRAASRARVFPLAPALLAPRQIGPDGEWAKVPRELASLWGSLGEVPTTLQHLVVNRETPYRLTVATTPRYYISAAYRDLDRASKLVLYFASAQARDRAALVLNSSIPYLWWRALDGGVTLPKRVLLSTPVPPVDVNEPGFAALIRELQETEDAALTCKLNAGRPNENIKRAPALVARLNAALLGHAPDLRTLYTQDITEFDTPESPV